MDKLLTKAGILGAVLGIAFFVAPAIPAFAQEGGDSSYCIAWGTCDVTVQTIGPTAGDITHVVTEQPNTAGGTTHTEINPLTGQSETANTDRPIDFNGEAGAGKCSFSDVTTWPECILRAVAGALLTFTNILLGIAGTLLNWAVVKTVFQFSQFIGNSPGLLIAWGIMRDVANILILFGFVLLAIGTILNTDKMPNRRMLPGLIIFAVLLNFSLFVSEAVIDASNVLSTVIYSQANTDPCWTTNGQGECGINYGIAGHIMQSTGLSSALDTGSDVTRATRTEVMLGLILFSFIGAIVLFAGAILIIIRGVVLSFLMLLSPIGFAGLVVPKLQSTARNYWRTLVSQAFFAPIFLLLIFVSLKITDGFSAQPGANGSLAAALTTQDTTAMGVLLVFFSVIGFMVASLIAAQKFGAMGADGVMKFAGTASLGTAGFIGRRTIGAGSMAAGRAIRSRIGATETGRILAGVADKGAQANYDLRMNKTVQGLAKKQGLNLGTLQGPAKKGLKGIQEAEEKKRTAHADTLKMSDTEKALQGELNKEVIAGEKSLKGMPAEFDAKKKKVEGDWTAREKELTAKIQELEAKPKINEEEERARLEREIAIERAKGEGTVVISERLESNANLAKLEEEMRGLGDAAKRDTDELNNLRSALTMEGGAYKKKIQELEEKQVAEKIDMEATITVKKEQAAQLDPKERYAQTLERQSQEAFIPLSIEREVKKEAAESIRKSIKKSGGEKAADALKKAITAEKPDDKEIAKAVDALTEEMGKESETQEGK